MASWQATYEDPVHYDYCGVRVFKTDVWGQGPVFLQLLALLEGFRHWSAGHSRRLPMSI